MRKENTALAGNAKVAAHQRLRRRNAEANHQFRFDCRELRVQPGAGTPNLNAAKLARRP
jgi:hypothetical protein